jgi:hypothetical protein
MARANRVDSSERAILMQRCEGPKRTDTTFDLGIDPHRSRVPRSTVDHAVPNSIGIRKPGQRVPHCLSVNSAIWQFQVTAPEHCRPAIKHSQPQRTRARVHDQDAHAGNDTGHSPDAGAGFPLRTAADSGWRVQPSLVGWGDRIPL